MKALLIAGVFFRRLLRDRVGAFATFALPLLLIMLLGALSGSFEYRVGLVTGDAGPLATELADGLRSTDGIKVTDYPDSAALLDAIAHNDRDAGIIIPTGYDADLRAGRDVVLEYLATSEVVEFGVGGFIEAEVSAQAARISAARLAASSAGLSFEQGMEAAGAAADVTSGIEVRVVGVGDRELVTLGSFDDVTARMLLLFVFLIGAAASGELIRSRELGMSRRMLGTPTSATTIIVGETAGRVLVAVVQSLVIVVISTLVFGVTWGSLPATLAVIVVFSLVSGGFGMLLGSLLRRVELAESLGSFIALGLAMIGGAMFGGGGGFPVPHAWAVDAFEKIMLQRAALPDILTELGVLALYAGVFIAIAAVALRRAITGSHV